MIPQTPFTLFKRRQLPSWHGRTIRHHLRDEDEAPQERPTVKSAYTECLMATAEAVRNGSPFSHWMPFYSRNVKA